MSHTYDALMDALAAWRGRLESLLARLEALPPGAAYQFDPTQVPHLLDGRA